ncbi:MAG: ABC transporter permease [Acidobacteriota bacterium]|nr:ABC transporter permease [Acidobacteriota bacterium]
MDRVGNLLKQLIRDLRAQRLRTLLTILGIVWGTVAVSLLLAFGDGFHHQLLKNSAGLGNGIVVAWPSLTSIPFEGLGKGRPIRMDESDIELLRASAQELGWISSEYASTLKLQQGTKTLAVDTVGAHPIFGEMRNMFPQAGGRFIDPFDMRNKRRVVFLGNEVAEQLFGTGDPVGQTLRLHGSPFTVIGVLKKKTQDSSYRFRDKDMAVIPATTMRALTGQKYMNNFVFTAKDIARTKQATAEVLRVVAAKHRFDPEDKEALSVWDTSDMAKFLDTFMLAFRLFLGIVGSLTLVVGGIGVSNIMNVVVEERTREIGIKMALGATPGGILGQFLMETLVITVVGGGVGLGITIGLCSLFPAFGVTEYVGDPNLTPALAIGTVVLLGTIGLIAGYFPARTAASLDPVVAMKM